MSLILCWLASSGAYGIEPLWSFSAPIGTIDCTPAVADIDHDGMAELVLATTAGSVIVLDHQGQTVWMRGVQIPISIPPTVADIAKGPGLEVLVLNQAGSLSCMDGRTGDVLWRYDLPGPIEWGASAIVAADLDNDGKMEIIAGDKEGHVVCLSPQGELLWQFDGPHGSTYCPAVGNLGEEENSCILISGSKLPLLCLGADGKERWRVDKPGKGASPILADLNGDGENEVITGLDNSVVAVDGEGKVLWVHPMKKELDSTLCAADANEDGKLEIYAIDLAGQFAAISNKGKTLWMADVFERVRRSPAVGDIDGDGDIELVVAGYSEELYVFSADGELKETFDLPALTNASPIIVDFHGDGTPTLIVTPGQGALAAYRWPGAEPNAKVLWPEYRYNSARKGIDTARIRSPVRIRDVNFGNLYVGINTVDMAIANPEKHPLVIEITIDPGDTKPRIHRFERQDDEISIAANYAITGVEPSTVRIDCSVFDGDLLVAQRRKEAYVLPFRKELDDLRTVLDHVRSSAAVLPVAHAAMGHVVAVENKLPDYEAQALVAGTVDSATRHKFRNALQEDLKAVGRLDRLLDAAVESQTAGDWPLQLSAANPWAPFAGMDEIVEERLSDADLMVEAFLGETECAALNVFNHGAETVTARVEVDDFVLEGKSFFRSRNQKQMAIPARGVVTLHEVVAVATQTLDTIADALPRMNDANVAILPGHDARQIWLNVNTKHLSPGTWTSAVRFRSLDVEAREFIAPLRVTVWEAALPEIQPLRHCNWGYVDSSRHQHYEDQSLEDRVAHGNNVFVSKFVPRVRFDEGGNLVGEIDYARHDEFVEKYSPHGIILFHNTGGIWGTDDRDTKTDDKKSNVKKRKSKPHGEAYLRAYRKAYHAWMRQWVQHLQKMGIDYDQYAMYPVDEPGLREGLVERYLYYAKLTREADPKVQMYTDPVMRITKEELTEMLPFVDIWCPNRFGFLLGVGADKLEIIKDSGAELWTYECEGNAKHQSPLGYYRGQSWLAWRHGLTGVGFWSYCTSKADPWYKPKDTQDYLMTYQGDCVVSSKRWEAVRDGIEDYSMLYVLRAVVEKSQSNSRWRKDVEAAEAILGERAFAISEYCEKDDTTPGAAGLPGVRSQADHRWATIQETRREIAKLLQHMSQE